MKVRTILVAIFATLTAATTVFADEPFRNHRYDSFTAGRVTPQSIVFVGNSITNMGCWAETFGDDVRCINRGNSGAVSSETLENIESVLYGHPAKIFLMIGTNDLGTQYAEDIPFNNVKDIVARVQDESPETIIYLTSVFPSTVGYRTLEGEKSLNTRYQTLVDNEKIFYLDLWDDLMSITTGEISLDKLHLSPVGYKIWCDAAQNIAGDQTLNSSLIAGSDMTVPTCGLSTSNGMRCMMFCELPIKANDVWVLGDELVNGGEWQELLGLANVKNRGYNWAYGGLTITQYTNTLETMLTNDADKISKVAPKQIFFYVGTSELSSNTAVNTFIQRYSALIEKAKSVYPTTELYAMSLTPSWTTSTNTLTKTYNEQLKALAEETGVTYVDIFTPLSQSNGTPDPQCMPTQYVFGKGYNKIAQTIGKYIEGATVLSDEEFDLQYATIKARNTLGKTVTTAKSIVSSSNLTEQYKTRLQEAIDNANALLRSTSNNADEFTAQAETLTNLTDALTILTSGDTDYRETLKSKLEEIENSAAQLNLGDEYGQYSISYENWDADLQSLRDMLAENSESYDEYECALCVTRLQDAIANVSINVPVTGSYIRVKASKNYISSSSYTSTFNGVQNYMSSSCKQNTVNGSTDYQAICVNSKTDENEATTIFYYAPLSGSEYGYLISYNDGRYAYNGKGNMLGFHQGDASTNASVATIVGFQSALAEDGAYHLRYNISGSDIESARVLAISGNGAVVNGGAASSEKLKGYVWSNVELEKVTELPVTIDSDGSAAAIFPVAVTVPADAAAKFYATTLADGTLTLHQLAAGETLAAGTAFIITGTADATVRFEIADANANDAYVCNSIYGYPALSAYVATDGTTSFAKATSTNANTISFATLSDEIAAYKPVIDVQSETIAEAYKTGFDVALEDGDITFKLTDDAGVSTIVVDKLDGKTKIYDIQGRRISNPTNGYYIVNGKKVRM